MRKWGNGNSDKEKRGQYCSTAHPLRVARAVRARLTCGDASFSFVSAIMLPRFFILGADIVLLVGLGVLARCESSPPISAPQNWTVPLCEATVVCGVCLGFWLTSHAARGFIPTNASNCLCVCATLRAVCDTPCPTSHSCLLCGTRKKPSFRGKRHGHKGYASWQILRKKEELGEE